ncbi:hypothetical protein EDB89DRAFT_2230743 [Lactarius sanguifluus]|nr:hypothetical protein EDB89DRAFT_2230743 [Lactarius sanguifluus]
MGTQRHCPASLQSSCGTGENYGDAHGHATTISMLPDNVLLEIFDFYLSSSYTYCPTTWQWHVLAHVCQTWRQLVFASPHRLNLRIICTQRTPVRKNLGIWPAFPIVIDYRRSRRILRPKEEENIIAALEHPNRVCQLELNITGSQLEKMAATVMQATFPVLTCLDVLLTERDAAILPSGFLGGSAPLLRSITLCGIPYPALPTLLLSVNDLVKLDLQKIPPTGYISPKAMVMSLETLPRLETFIIEFQSATSRPDRIHPPPITPTVLPTLTKFHFKGAIEYLEDLVAQIDGPQLDQIVIKYLNWVADFRFAQLTQFINRSEGPELAQFKHAKVTLLSNAVVFETSEEYCEPWDWCDTRIVRVISYEGNWWKVSHMVPILSQFSATLFNVVHLRLGARPKENRQLEDVDWLRLLHQFSTIQTLHVPQKFAEHVALALEDITGRGEMVAEVLPTLDLIYLEGQPSSSIEKFVAARCCSGRPVTIIDTERAFNERLGCR